MKIDVKGLRVKTQHFQPDHTFRHFFKSFLLSRKYYFGNRFGAIDIPSLYPESFRKNRKLLRKCRKVYPLHPCPFQQNIKLPTNSYRIPIFSRKYFRVIVFIFCWNGQGFIYPESVGSILATRSVEFSGGILVRMFMIPNHNLWFQK